MNFCKPAVDPLFNSAINIGAGAWRSMLTGMGTDGMRGAKEIVEAGGSVSRRTRHQRGVGHAGRRRAGGLCAAVLPSVGSRRVVRLFTEERS